MYYMHARARAHTHTHTFARPCASCMVWYGMVDVCEGAHVPATDRDSVTRQTLRAGIRAPPPEKPYLCIGAWENAATVRPELNLKAGNVTCAAP